MLQRYFIKLADDNIFIADGYFKSNAVAIMRKHKIYTPIVAIF